MAVFKIIAFQNGDMGTDRVVHMDAGEYIGAGIRLIQGSHCGGENIFIRVNGRAEVRSIPVKGADDQEDRHSGKEECAHPVKILLILKQKEEKHTGYI